MTEKKILQTIYDRLIVGEVIPYLGAGVLDGVTSVEDGKQIPADSESLILAMNNGSAMAPKLMYEFPRAAMNLELKKGRKFIERFLTGIYLEKQWHSSKLHKWLSSLGLPYIIDGNRDTQLQSLYRSQPHILIVGQARIAGSDYRFKIYHFQKEYQSITLDQVDTTLPVLFKPMGSPLPEPTYIASDADYVDYITELMGGFAIPKFVKEHRKDKQYLLLGLRLKRDTERMVLSEFMYDANQQAGWALLPNANSKEARYCENNGIQVINADWQELLAIAKQSETLSA